VLGYDPLARFKAGKPVKGTKEFSTTRNGAEFRFASAANRDAFKKHPEAYAPQYGGCCAWAVSQGYTAKGDAKFCKNRRWETVSQLQQSGAKKWEGGVTGFIA
jgi:YHS domain-containing protein